MIQKYFQKQPIFKEYLATKLVITFCYVCRFAKAFRNFLTVEYGPHCHEKFWIQWHKTSVIPAKMSQLQPRFHYMDPHRYVSTNTGCHKPVVHCPLRFGSQDVMDACSGQNPRWSLSFPKSRGEVCGRRMFTCPHAHGALTPSSDREVSRPDSDALQRVLQKTLIEWP